MNARYFALGSLALVLCACQAVPRDDDEDLPLVGRGLVVDEEIRLPDPEPDLYRGEERRRKVPREFRAATWNVSQLTSETRNNPIKIKTGPAPVQTLAKADAIFKALETFDVDIAALQEVYQSGDPTVAFPLPGTMNGYTILKGPNAIKSNSAAPQARRNEYCPIAYLESKFKCDSTRVSQDSAVHWASCTINATSPQVQFYFGCGHFPHEGAELAVTLGAFFRELDGDRPRVRNSKATQDNFIVGVDANSNPSGMGQMAWQRFVGDAWNTAHPNNKDAIELPEVGPPGPATTTKMYRNADGKVVVTSTVGARRIDFLFHSLKPEIKYKPGSMSVLPVKDLYVGLSGQRFWNEYFPLSDHIPVKADYTY